MPSAIDPSKPFDGGPASKADLRANLEAAKRELEHGGFFRSSLPGAVERKVADKLEDWVSIKEFGAVGNGTADDTAALQASIDAKVPTYFPTGRYKVTQPLTYVFGFAWRGESPASYSTSEPHFPRSHIFASTPFANPDEPMIHPRDVWVGVDSVVHVGPSPARNLNVVIMEDLSLANAGHANAQTGYFRYLLAPSRIVGCRIGGMRRWAHDHLV